MVVNKAVYTKYVQNQKTETLTSLPVFMYKCTMSTSNQRIRYSHRGRFCVRLGDTLLLWDLEAGLLGPCSTAPDCCRGVISPL